MKKIIITISTIALPILINLIYMTKNQYIAIPISIIAGLIILYLWRNAIKAAIYEEHINLYKHNNK